jgi:hypothetical protein
MKIYDIIIDQIEGKLIYARSEQDAIDKFLKDLTLDELLQFIRISAEQSS